MRNTIIIFYLIFVGESSFAAYMTADFIRKHEVVLAQFVTYEKVSKEELLRLDVTLATVTDPNEEPPIQFYLIYRAGSDSRPNRYYYLIDRKMRSSWPLLDFGLYGDQQTIPQTFLPNYLVDDSVTVRMSGKSHPDAFSYFGEMDPLDVELYELQADNGYKIKIEHYGFHGPQNMLDGIGSNTHIVAYLRTYHSELNDKLLERLLFRSVYYSTGYVAAEDTFTAKDRAEYIAKEEISLIARLGTPEFTGALNDLLARVNTYIERANANKVKDMCSRLLQQAADKAKKGPPKK